MQERNNISAPVRVAIIGMGGFARTHHEAISHLEREGVCRLAATCDVRPDLHDDFTRAQDFAGRGVRVYDDWETMLAQETHRLEMVTVPTPVPLHLPMHKAVVARGLACYLEKPPTLWPDELAQMIATDANAPFATNVGFNFTIEPARQALKRRLLSGEFGRLQSVALCGLWPRGSQYYARAPWAGRLFLNGTPVLDSPIGNALGHQLQNVLMWAGERDALDWADVATLEAELYRAHPIESFDTVFVAARTGSGVTIRIAASHACDNDAARHYEEVVCEGATIRYSIGKSWQIRHSDGKHEAGESERGVNAIENLRQYFAYLAGNEPRPLNRLVDSLPFVRFHSLCFVASQTITAVKPAQRQVQRDAEGNELRAIIGIGEACQRFVQTGAWPRETGNEWAVTQPRASAVFGDEAKLPQTIHAIQIAAGAGDANGESAHETISP